MSTLFSDEDVVSTADPFELLNRLRAYDKQTIENGIATYRPHRKQDLFHRLGGIKYRYVRTGNRFGKSDCGSAEDVAWALGERPWYSKDDPARYEGIPKKPTKGLLLCTDWPKVEEVFTSETKGKTQGKFWKWIPKAAFIRRDTNHSGHINKITIKSIWGGESTIYIDTVQGFKHNEQRGESDWYDYIHVDEPIPKAMWESFSRGLIDTNGSAWFTCTPLAQPWINLFFLPSNRHVLDKQEPNFFPNKRGNKIDRVVIVGASEDNPYVTEAAIEDYMEGLDEKTKQARRFGIPLDQTGLVHGAFSIEHQYTEPPPGWSDLNKPPLDYTLRYHIDCHPSTPHAVLFSATAPSGQIFIFDEIFEACDAQTLADQIQNKIKGYFCPVELCDPSGFIESMSTKTSFADDLVKFGLNVEKASKDLKRGIMMTNWLLNQRMLNGDPQIMFASNLWRTLYEFDNYVYDSLSHKPDQPKDVDDHMMEGLHRLVLGGLDYIETVVYDAPMPAAPRHSLLSF